MVQAYPYYSEYIQRDHLEDLRLNNNNNYYNFCLYKQQASQGSFCSVQQLQEP